MFNLPKLQNNKKFEVISINESGEEIELKYNDGIILLDYSKGYFEEITEPPMKFQCWDFYDIEKNKELELKQIGKTTYLLKETKTGIWNVFNEKELENYMENNPFCLATEKEKKEMSEYELFTDPYKQVVISCIEDLERFLSPEYQY